MPRASLGAGNGETVTVAMMIELEDDAETLARAKEGEVVEPIAGSTSAISTTKMIASEAMVAVVLVVSAQIDCGPGRKWSTQKRRTAVG